MRTTTKPYRLKEIRLKNDLNIAYIDEGNGPVLLFIHGLASYLHAWQKNIIPLSHQFRCIALDLPNFGQSIKGDFPCTMTFYAELVHDLITALELESVTLIGHSMGGQIATHVAFRYPEKLTNLILIAPAGFEEFSDLERQWFRTFYKPVFIKTMKMDQIRNNFELNFSDVLEEAEFMFQDRLQLMENEDAFEQYCKAIPKCVLGMLEEPVFDRLNQLRVPTLVIFGAEDKLIPNRLLHKKLTTTKVAKAGCQEIPNCSLKIIPNSGHFVQFEAAELVNESIIAHIEEKVSGPSSDMEVIQQFFESFKRGDATGMAACYADAIQFEDPVFGKLEGDQVKAMWFMLLSSKDSDLRIRYTDIQQLEHSTYSCSWEADYVFSQTNNKVKNQVQSTLWLEGGKIVRQVDQFNFWTWASQAFGTTGTFLGGLPMFKNKVKQGARRALQKFMEKAGR